MKPIVRRISIAAVLFLSGTLLFRCGKTSLPPGDPGNGGLALPDQFEALVVVDSTGKGRHLAVTDEGNIYMKFRNSSDKGMVAIAVDPATGKATKVERFGGYPDEGNNGTGSRIFNGYLYFSTDGMIFRTKLQQGKLVPEGKIDTVLIDDYRHDVHGYEHTAKPIAFDEDGNMFIAYGAPGDVCQLQNRIPGAPGQDPCPQLEDHAGIWKFDPNKLHQTQKDGEKYATGIRSIVALSWNKEDHTLYAVVHGRDDLNSRNAALFSRWQSAIYPSEEFIRVKKGNNFGWPYYYYDQVKGKRVLNPEYGGDGINQAKGEQFDQPIMGFPGHWAPNDLLFYTGDQFPERYRHGAFIAFHGSTNRAPYPQAGYFVAFIPFENGKPNGSWEVFADGFIGVDPVVNTSDAKARPMGLAMGPDGSLYISDSVNGKIWRVMFKGNKDQFGSAQLAKMEEHKKNSNIRTPDEVSDNLDKGTVAGGQRIYRLYCGPCHQRNGQGAEGRFPSLAKSPWVTGDKTRLIKVILDGLEGSIEVNGQKFNNVMPKHNFLKDEEAANVITFIRQNFGNNAGEIKPAEVAKVRASLQKKAKS